MIDDIKLRKFRNLMHNKPNELSTATIYRGLTAKTIRLFRQDNPVAPAALGAIERLIGLVQQLIDRNVALDLDHPE